MTDAPVIRDIATGDVGWLVQAHAEHYAESDGFDLSFDDPNPDGQIVFSLDFLSLFDFDPSDGILPARYDFEAVVVHEIAHALGFFSRLGTVDFQRSQGLVDEVARVFGGGGHHRAAAFSANGEKCSRNIGMRRSRNCSVSSVVIFFESPSF